MKLLVDIQGCQTASRFRGIGRYSLALAEALIRNRGPHDVYLLANGAFTEGLAALRAQFAPRLPEDHFIVFDAERPVAEVDERNGVRARLAELARERLIASIAPDAVLMTSLFEGFVDDAVTSVGCSLATSLTAVTLYDLIPYLSPDPEWPAHYKYYYDRKIASLRRADLLLSISEYARREASGAIPELAGRIVNMSSASDALFRPGKVDAERRQLLYERLDLRHPFVMSASTLDSRKNFEQLIRSFAAMPENLGLGRQVVVVGDGLPEKVEALRLLARETGLAEGQLVITGHVSNEDLRDLYRLCDLFVFPSKHEGFGLPPLEAMSCGAPVIGSRATSVPEVIGREDALFDPSSDEQLRDLMVKALTDATFRKSLKAHGVARAQEFSWDKTAVRALETISARVAGRRKRKQARRVKAKAARPRLAMVSPMPPEQTGIADYVHDLMPELEKHYDVTVISDQPVVSPGPSGEAFRVRSTQWFEAKAGRFARVVYQMGNSPFHAHMVDLMARYPGVVVLHDFFLSSLKLWKEATGYRSAAFKRSLVDSHGYGALAYLEQEGEQAAKFRWPCSFSVMRSALRVIVHSCFSRELVRSSYGESFAHKCTVVRQHRAPVAGCDRAAARNRLGLAPNAFLVCAFGFMDETKLNHRLVEAWRASSLAADHNCRLAFVGGRAGGSYAQALDEAISPIDDGVRIRITGFAAHGLFADYLAAADAAVQLRTLSRGETSRAVLDCLAHGVPLVLNAHGPNAEYPDDVLIKLADEFSTKELVEALERLYSDGFLRDTLSRKGQAYVANAHAPALTVQGYMEVVEEVAALPECRETVRVVSRLWKEMPEQPLDLRYEAARRAMDLLMVPRRPVIYLDISATARSDLKTGIERVARALLNELLVSPPPGYLVAPAYLTEEEGLWRVRRGNAFLSRQPGFSLVTPDDDLVIPGEGDILMALDLFTDGVCAAERQGLYTYWKAAGARVAFMIHDLLPVTHPEFFPPWAEAMHEDWLRSISRSADLLVGVSRHVKAEMAAWLTRAGVARKAWPRLEVSYHGADVSASFPGTGLPDDAEGVLASLDQRPAFLMVGTIEPRKGHLAVLDAFESLWRQGVEANLVIVGHEGWKGLQDADRRTIPEIVRRIRSSPELGHRLFWLEGISDEYLEKVYAVSACLIAASEDEGFGLPLIEAFRHGIPVLARDISVFREVGGRWAQYFPAEGCEGLIEAIRGMLNRKRRRRKKPVQKDWLTWRESARNLIELISVYNES